MLINYDIDDFDPLLLRNNKSAAQALTSNALDIQQAEVPSRLKGRFKDEACLSSCVFSKLPCVKSIDKTVTERKIGTENISLQTEIVKNDQMDYQSSELNPKRPFYYYLSN